MTDTGITSPWALAWVLAFQQATRSDAVLQQGHSIHAADGAPAVLNSSPGRVSAEISPHHTAPARATIHITLLNLAEQQIIAAALADGPLRAAVLKGQRPAALADPAHTGGIPLVPRAKDLSFACECAQAPCQHTAALGHALTERLQANPALMMSLRGLSHRQLTGLLQAQPTAAPATPLPLPPQNDQPRTPERTVRPLRPAGPHIVAHQAFQSYDPAAGPRPMTPREPVATDGDGSVMEAARFSDVELPEPPSSAPPLRLLRHLIMQAAHQARQLLDDGYPLELDPVVDAVRLLASLPAAERDDMVAYRLGLEPHTLRSLVTAYDLAGAPGVHATRNRDPDDPQILRRPADAVTPLSPDPTVPSATGDSRVTGPAAGVEGRPGS
ncbi:hypothetical protein [Nonomuraea sp. NPDC050540]|uniref:hypothetical protein n=1 Tax=Nonomuraea sp. NPDC050540 TaxID=3364367 RepID=UPI0037A4081D